MVKLTNSKGAQKTWISTWKGKHLGLNFRWVLVGVTFRKGVVKETWKGSAIRTRGANTHGG